MYKMQEIGSFERLQEDAKNKFKNLPSGCTKINIEFCNLSYEVPDHKAGIKCILKNINGNFHSNQLTAVMGTSGSGKTTLINLLAGYRIRKTAGHINVNGKPQNLQLFKKISRYIQQHDHISPYFTVMESMLFAARLKLDSHLSVQQLVDEINKILKCLQITNQANTRVANLSGGERKRLCIALELLNLPAVLFLDEPTTGLDEVSAIQCVSILKLLVQTGRTIICSIHAPSAKIFQMFDHVYVLAEGECVYQGSTTNILPYIAKIGLNCPINYNPADFIIEVAGREYGNYHESMVNEIKNGKTCKWLAAGEIDSNQNEYRNSKRIAEFEMELNTNSYGEFSTPWLLEYKILYIQMLKHMWRDKNYIKLKVFIKLFTVLCISVVYKGIGRNAAMIILNYHLVFLTSITFVFLSMCPMLSHIPLEINYLRREHFNQWYRLSSYFMALITSQIPDIFTLGLISSAMLYFVTDQPVELNRFLLFLLVVLLTSLTASSFGLALSSRLNLLNSLFFGPSMISCWVLFSNCTIENPNITIFEKILMYSGYIRHSVEGLLSSLLEFNRPEPICPVEVALCLFKKPKYLLKILGYEDLNYFLSVIYLIGFYLFFNIIGYVNFKCRLDCIKFLERNRYYQKLKRGFGKFVYLKSH